MSDYANYKDVYDSVFRIRVKLDNLYQQREIRSTNILNEIAAIKTIDNLIQYSVKELDDCLSALYVMCDHPEEYMDKTED